MRYNDYTTLCYAEKRELLRLNGSFIAEKDSRARGKRAIYALYDFYVEVDYSLSDQERYIRVLDSYYKAEEQPEGILINLN